MSKEIPDIVILETQESARRFQRDLKKSLGEISQIEEHLKKAKSQAIDISKDLRLIAEFLNEHSSDTYENWHAELGVEIPLTSQLK